MSCPSHSLNPVDLSAALSASKGVRHRSRLLFLLLQYQYPQQKRHDVPPPQGAACYGILPGARRIRPTGGRREATESRSGAGDGGVWILLARLAGWIDVDAHMRFDGNEES